MPQAAIGAMPTAAVTQVHNFPGVFLTPQSLVQVQTPFLAQVPGVAGGAPTLQQIIPVTSFVVRPLTEAEQNTLAHQEFQRIWEAQAIRNLALPVRPVASASPTTAPASVSPVPVSAPTVF
ncbi:hypothetical protein SK128_012885 [Halocaridina rubra]|uniref:Uncharacterized protein n=1 Tax=Halocaridina rubra TaxID=373956 RepID=A0AAN8ZZ54_HALRR